MKKKLLTMLMVAVLSASVIGCGSQPNSQSEATTQDLFEQEISYEDIALKSKIKENEDVEEAVIDSYCSIFSNTINVSIDINDGGKMAIVADLATDFVKEYIEEYIGDEDCSFDIMINYEDSYIVSWHSTEFGYGFLYNSLSGYSKPNVSIEELYQWNNGELSGESTTESIDVPDYEETTTGQQNALDKALDYLDYSAFSEQGLKDQLEYEGFEESDIDYAVENCGADWNEQAAKKAQQYLDYSSFSKERLIEQLEYEGFTEEQAQYGVNQVYNQIHMNYKEKSLMILKAENPKYEDLICSGEELDHVHVLGKAVAFQSDVG